MKGKEKKIRGRFFFFFFFFFFCHKKSSPSRQKRKNDAAPSVSPRLSGLSSSSSSEREAFGNGCAHARVEGRDDPRRSEREAVDDADDVDFEGQTFDAAPRQAPPPREIAPRSRVRGGSGRCFHGRFSLARLGAGRMGLPDLHVRCSVGKPPGNA